jgi:hypothetical protein
VKRRDFNECLPADGGYFTHQASNCKLKMDPNK